MPGLPKLEIDTDRGANTCFGCGQENPLGLKLTFRLEGETTRSEYIPEKRFEGWPGILHGGIVSLILDEAVSHAASLAGRNTVTAKLAVKFLKPTPVGQPLVISAIITRNTRRLVEAIARINLKDGTLTAEASALMYVVSPNTTQREAAHV